MMSFLARKKRAFIGMKANGRINVETLILAGRLKEWVAGMFWVGGGIA